MKKQRILVVEDERPVRENLQRCLEYEGYEVEAAGNGSEAIASLKTRLPDLVLCDLMMPETDGMGVLTHLRGDPAAATLPFIFLTANTDVKNVIAATRLRANEYVTKPFRLPELIGLIKQRLEAAKNGRR